LWEGGKGWVWEVGEGRGGGGGGGGGSNSILALERSPGE